MLCVCLHGGVRYLFSPTTLNFEMELYLSTVFSTILHYGILSFTISLPLVQIAKSAGWKYWLIAAAGALMALGLIYLETIYRGMS